MSDSFQQRVLTTVQRLKAEPPDEVTTLPVFAWPRGVGRRQQIARLEPVGWRDAESSESVKLLARWREAAGEAFPAVFPVTIDGTRRWLVKQLLDTPDRMLFWVVAPDGQKIGHVGLFRFDFAARQTEIDNIVRGVPGLLPGVMEAAVRTLLDWTFDLEMDDIFLRVFSDNPRAIQLYERCGFRETMRMPLERLEEGNIVRWLEVDGLHRGAVTRYFVTMQLPRAEWIAANKDFTELAA